MRHILQTIIIAILTRILINYLDRLEWNSVLKKESIDNTLESVFKTTFIYISPFLIGLSILLGGIEKSISYNDPKLINAYIISAITFGYALHFIEKKILNGEWLIIFKNKKTL